MTKRTSIIFVEGKRETVVSTLKNNKINLGVSGSSFSAVIVLKQNALQHLETNQQEALVALDCFHVDDSLMGADSIHEASHFRRELYTSCLIKEASNFRSGKQVRGIFL